MKYIISLALLVVFGLSLLSMKDQSPEAGVVNWITFEELEKSFKKEPRPILFDVYTDWCGPCQMMKKRVFTDPKLVRYINDNYYAVAVNAEARKEVKFNGKTFSWKPEGRNGYNEIADYVTDNKCIGYPTISIMDKNKRVVYAKSQYHEIGKMLYLLKKHNKE